MGAENFISEATLRNCWTANPDGAGFAYINEYGKAVVEKYMTFKSFYAAYKQADETYSEMSDFLIHFRITSRGATRLDNCHPFQINDTTAFIHNGTITSMPIDKEHQHSDTFMFNELVLKQLPYGFEQNDGIRYLIEDIIGWSKIVVLNAETGLTIYNEEKGVYDGNIWYSNTSYKDRWVYYQRNTTYNKKDDNDNDDVFNKVDHDWDWTQESYDEYKRRKALLSQQNNVILLNHKPNEDKGETKPIDADSIIYIHCNECDDWADEEDIYLIEDVPGELKFVCEDCLLKREAADIPYTIVNVEKEEYDTLKQKQIAC